MYYEEDKFDMTQRKAKPHTHTLHCGTHSYNLASADYEVYPTYTVFEGVCSGIKISANSEWTLFAEGQEER